MKDFGQKSCNSTLSDRSSIERIFAIVMKQHADTNPSIFLTTADLAARWKVTPMTLRRWRKAGKLKACHLGRGVRFSQDEIARFERDATV